MRYFNGVVNHIVQFKVLNINFFHLCSSIFIIPKKIFGLRAHKTNSRKVDSLLLIGPKLIFSKTSFLLHSFKISEMISSVFPINFVLPGSVVARCKASNKFLYCTKRWNRKAPRLMSITCSS